MVASDQVLATGAQLDTLSINTIRTLAIDAVQQANSGHPGAPMGLAPVAYCLWQRIPALRSRRSHLAQSRPLRSIEWPRFHAALRDVASCRGARRSTSRERTKELAVSMDDIKHFRQLGSRTPGHPESHITSGVETTTGPLGQGIGNSVGMAIAGKWQARELQPSLASKFSTSMCTRCAGTAI